MGSLQFCESLGEEKITTLRFRQKKKKKIGPEAKLPQFCEVGISLSVTSGKDMRRKL